MSFQILLSALRSSREQVSTLVAVMDAIERDLVHSTSELERFKLEDQLRLRQDQLRQRELQYERLFGELHHKLPQLVKEQRDHQQRLRHDYDRRALQAGLRMTPADGTRFGIALGELQQLDEELKQLERTLAAMVLQRLSAVELEARYEQGVSAEQRARRCEALASELAQAALHGPPAAHSHEPPLSSAVPTRHIVIPYSRNPAFTGRKTDLRRLHKAMSLEDSRLGESVTQASPSPIFVTGLPGVGKTQLTMEYAYHNLTAFQMILWVNAEGDNISPAMARVAREVLPTSPLEPDEVVVQRLLKHLEQGGPHLLILDNVTSPKAYGDLLPRLGQTRVIITARRRDLSLYALDNKRDLRVCVLPPRTALALLLRGRRLAGEELAAAERLCEELGYLPLALAIAAQALRITEDSPAALLRAICEQGPTLWSEQVAKNADLEEDERRFIRSYPSLPRLFDATYSLVSKHCPHAELVAQCAGSFAPAAIERQLLLEATDALALASGGPVQPLERSKQALGWLIRLGLAESAGAKSVSFHWLVQDYLRHKGGDKARQAFLAALSQLVQSVYASGLTPTNLLKLVAHRSHIERADRLLTDRDEQSSFWISLGLIWLMTLCGEYAAVLQRCTELHPLIKDPYLRAWLWHQHGWVLLPLGHYREALGCLRQAFAIRRRLPRTTALELCFELQDIARAQISLGRYVSARRCLLSAERCLRGVKNAQMRQLGEALVAHQLGRVDFYQGRFPEAVSLYYKSLSIKRQCNSNNDRLYANTLHALGELHCITGEYEQALEKFEHALHIRKQTSLHHPDILSTQEGIAQVYLRQGRYAAAAVAFQDAGLHRERLLGGTHPDLAANLEGLGRALIAQGNLEHGWQTLRRAYFIRHRALGSRHPFLASSYEALAECALLRGQHRRAHALFVRAQQVRVAVTRGCNDISVGPCGRDSSRQPTSSL